MADSGPGDDDRKPLLLLARAGRLRSAHPGSGEGARCPAAVPAPQTRRTNVTLRTLIHIRTLIHMVSCMGRKEGAVTVHPVPARKKVECIYRFFNISFFKGPRSSTARPRQVRSDCIQSASPSREVQVGLPSPPSAQSVTEKWSSQAERHGGESTRPDHHQQKLGENTSRTGVGTPAVAHAAAASFRPRTTRDGSAAQRTADRTAKKLAPRNEDGASNVLLGHY